MCPVSGRLSGPLRPEGTDQHVPVSRCVSAAGISFSVILFPPRDSALLTVGLPNPRSSTGPDLDRVPAFRTHEQRPGWLPLYPGDGGAHPDRKACPAGTCRIPSGQSLTSPPPTIRRQGPLDEASTRGSNDFSRPVFPSPGGPGQNGTALGFSSSFAPRRPRAGQRTSRRGQAIRARTWNYTLNIFELTLRSVVHSLRATSRRTALSGSGGMVASVTALVLAASDAQLAAPGASIGRTPTTVPADGASSRTRDTGCRTIRTGSTAVRSVLLALRSTSRASSDRGAHAAAGQRNCGSAGTVANRVEIPIIRHGARRTAPALSLRSDRARMVQTEDERARPARRPATRVRWQARDVDAARRVSRRRRICADRPMRFGPRASTGIACETDRWAVGTSRRLRRRRRSETAGSRPRADA